MRTMFWSELTTAAGRGIIISSAAFIRGRTATVPRRATATSKCGSNKISKIKIAPARPRASSCPTNPATTRIRICCAENRRSSVCPPRPAEFCRGGTRIGTLFLRGRADDFIGDGGINFAPQSGLKCFLHAPVFAGMKRENRHAAIGFQARGQVAQKSFKRGKFIVHRDAQCLKNTADVEVTIFLGDVRQRGANGVGEFVRGGKTFSRKRRAQLNGLGFVRIYRE